MIAHDAQERLRAGKRVHGSASMFGWGELFIHVSVGPSMHECFSHYGWSNMPRMQYVRRSERIAEKWKQESVG